MLSSKNNFTIVIVTFKSAKVIQTCLNSIDQKYAVIIVENSGDKNFNFFNNIKNKLTALEKNNFLSDYITYNAGKNI